MKKGALLCCISIFLNEVQKNSTIHNPHVTLSWKLKIQIATDSKQRGNYVTLGAQLIVHSWYSQHFLKLQASSKLGAWPTWEFKKPVWQKYFPINHRVYKGKYRLVLWGYQAFKKGSVMIGLGHRRRKKTKELAIHPFLSKSSWCNSSYYSKSS